MHGPTTSILSRKGFGFPDRLMTKLKLCFTFDTNATGYVTSVHLQTNTLIKPVILPVGSDNHQYKDFDQLETIYETWTVNGCQVMVNMRQKTPTSNEQVVLQFTGTTDDLLVPSLESACESDRFKTRRLASHAIKGTTFKRYVKNKRAIPDATKENQLESRAAPIASTDESYHLKLFTQRESGAGSVLLFGNVTMTAYVTFKGRKLLPLSVGV